MINIIKIQAELINLVGWRNNNKSLPLDSTSVYYPTRSQSGLYFQDAHPLLTLRNIAETMPEEWKGAATTQSSFVHYIKFITERAIANLTQNFLRIKSFTQESKELLENRILFYGAANRSSYSKITPGLRGFVLNPTQGKGITLRLEKVGLQFTSEMEGKEITLYLGRLGEIKPQYKIVIPAGVYNGNCSQQWFNIDSNNTYKVFDVSPIATDGLYLDTTAGQVWVIYYSTSLLLNQGASPLNVGRDWSKAPCTCNMQNYRNFQEISKYIQAYPFSSASTELLDDVPVVPVQEDVKPENKDNFGLNVQFSVGCDISYFIIEQKSMFASALQKQLAADVLREMAMNPDVRVNRNQANLSRMELLYEIDGAGDKPTGIKYELEKTLKALDLDTKDMARVCLQCKNKGVRYGTV